MQSPDWIQISARPRLRRIKKARKLVSPLVVASTYAPANHTLITTYKYPSNAARAEPTYPPPNKLTCTIR